MRSLLFVPGDDPRKLAKARASAADALILDLEDAVAPARKADARRGVREFLATERRQRVLVRINALDEPAAREDLAAVVAAAPDGIMLPKCRRPAELRILEHVLGALEVRDGVAPGSIGVLPIAFELAEAGFHARGYGGSTPRLMGLMWGVEDLAADLGSDVRGPDGAYLPALELGRSLCLYAAAAAGVPAVDAVYTDFRDDDGLARDAEAARRAGFACKAAIHPQQVAVINRVFTPDAEAIAHAERVVAAFRAAPDSGALALDGRMIDRPHLRAAERLLARAAAARDERS